jgi:xanthine dehydrogenase YagT iron-sulfur-binding subunit
VVDDDSDDDNALPPHGSARRRFLREAGVLAGGAAVSPYLQAADPPPRSDAAVAAPGATASAATPVPSVRTRLVVNGAVRDLELDPRTTLLDALREHLRLTGTKKGCDRGQCGACTVLVDGRRVNACLSLALSLDGRAITTIEGLGQPGNLHPMQQAFVTHDAYQCGYCTPGQVCSAVALVQEAEAGNASAVTRDVRTAGPIRLTPDEIRERMSGNLCRCGAYVNIVAAVESAAGGTGGRAPAGAGRRGRTT